MPVPKLFKKCVQAFVKRDYAGCRKLAMKLLSTTDSHELLQLLLISSQRLEQWDLVEQLSPNLLAATADNPWQHALIQLTLDIADPSEVFARAENETQRCQAFYYVGARLLTVGETEPAHKAFAACLALKAKCLERQLAGLELNATAPGAAAPSGADAQDQIERLNRQVMHLCQQGRYEQALGLATQARDLARQHFGSDHPSFATILNNLAGLYYSIGNYVAAEPLFRQAIEVTRTALGEDHPDFATSLNNLAALYKAMGNYGAAEPLYRQSLEIRRTALRENHPDFAASLNNLAGLYKSMGNYGAAEPMCRQAVEILRTALGENHPDFAASVNSLAALYQGMGNHGAAEPLYRQSLEIRRTALGEDHPAFATSLNNLALLYQAMGNYGAAEPLFSQALEIRRTALGENHPDFAASLGGLAGLYRSMGNYGAAEPMYRQTVEICRTALGECHPHFAAALNNLAGLYKSTGNHGAAEPMYRQAVEILRTALGENHPDFASSLNSLAELYRAMGNYEAAASHYLQALEIRRTALGEDHPDFASSLNNLALMYKSMGAYSLAEPLCQQALEIRRTTLGEDHLDFAASLNNLAGLYFETANYGAAEPLYRQSLEIRRTNLGEDHPSFGTSLSNLAGLYRSMGNYGAAEPMCRQAVEILRTTLGEEHPDFAVSLYNLAAFCVPTGRTSEAFSLTLQAAAIDDRMIGQVFSIGSESQRAAFLKMVQTRMEWFLSLVWRHLEGSPASVRAALELVLRRKAIGAESLAVQRDALLGGKYPSLESQLREWTILRRQIAQKTLAGPGPEGLPAHQKLMAEWNQQKEQLEAELARHVPEMNLEQKLRAADRRAVALALPAGVTLVEFVRFAVVDFQAVPARGQSRWQPARYLAFVLPAKQPDQVRMVDLGEAEPIDRMVADFRAGITSEVENQGKRDLGETPVEPVPAPGNSPGPTLRAAVFDKLLPALAGCKRLLLAPDGDLTRLPFEVLPTADGRCLIEEYAVSYLSCGRDALRFGAAPNRPPADPLVVADPDFDLGNDGSPAAATDVPHSRCSRDLDRGLRFGRLKGTHVEGERIAALLGVKPWLAAAALESRLKACRSPRILHLATHGFFLADQKHHPNKDFRDLGALPGPQADGLGRLSGSGLENPLLRSGLALAGANTWLQNDTPPAEAEDGLLTAEDVSGMDLLDTDLVVLSACETGLGEVHAGEGVFGLRRAFVLAGAKTLVMSLWKVPDQQTQELMEDFYRRLLRGQPRAEALRQAQLALKARFPNPLYWGAFICQGDAAALPLAAKPKQATQTARGTPPPPLPATTTNAKVKWVCPGCGKTLRGETNLSGKRVKCPSCAKVHAVPGTTG